MELDITVNSLPVYEALASKVRLNIIQLLSKRHMNVRELADALNLSSAIMTMHVKKLEKAKLITTRMAPGKGGVQKICSLATDKIEIRMPQQQEDHRKYHQTEISVGHYTDFEITPACGLASTKHIIGELDEPRYFWYPERVQAKIIWFNQGYIEYKVPNFLLPSQLPEELEISFEISSKIPFTNALWPVDLSFYLNQTTLGSWTSSGDFGDKRGKYTPTWWNGQANQHGVLKCLRVNHEGTFIDGNQISGITIGTLPVREKQWTFRMAVLDEAQHVGGLTLFGAGFGNYNQDLLFKLFYTQYDPQDLTRVVLI